MSQAGTLLTDLGGNPNLVIKSYNFVFDLPQLGNHFRLLGFHSWFGNAAAAVGCPGHAVVLAHRVVPHTAFFSAADHGGGQLPAVALHGGDGDPCGAVDWKIILSFPTKGAFYCFDFHD